MRSQTCCFTGHRVIPNSEIEQLTNRLSLEIINLIKRGYRYFGSGGALGFDMLAAEVVLSLKATYPHINLILVLPCRDQAKR